MKNKNILLGHGSGGTLSHELISRLFIKHFDNEILKNQGDSSILELPSNLISFTTDSFVVDPIEFPGGNIGKIAIDGTVNDLAVSGAKPLYLSASFIIEEGLEIEVLERIVETMAQEAKIAGVKIVTGDTKVVNRGKCDKLFINTTGIGLLNPEYQHITKGERIEPGDKILINGSIGDHGMAIMAARNELNMEAKISSDCAALNGLIGEILNTSRKVKFMRDATRGGLSTVLTEIFTGKDFGIQIEEENVVVKPTVGGMCDLLGFDPFYVANEGKVVLVVSAEDAKKVLEVMKSNIYGIESAIIGEVVNTNPGKGYINTKVGGRRIIDMLAGEQLPRIC